LRSGEKTGILKMLITTGIEGNILDEPNETTIATMEAAEKGEDLYGPFDTVKEMMEALDA